MAFERAEESLWQEQGHRLPHVEQSPLSLLALHRPQRQIAKACQPDTTVACATAADGNYLVVFGDAPPPQPPEEGATLEARDRNVAPKSLRARAEAIAALLGGSNNRPFERAAALIMLELDRVSANAITEQTNRRQFLACLNYGLRQHGLWVTYNPGTHALTFRHANADADRSREPGKGEERLPSFRLSEEDIKTAQQRARQAHSGVSGILQDYLRVPDANRDARQSDLQTRLRTAFEGSVGNFLGGAHGAVRWEAVRHELNNMLRLQRIEVDRVGNEQDGYTLVFHKLNDSFVRAGELIRVPLSRTAPAQPGDLLAPPKDPSDVPGDRARRPPPPPGVDPYYWGVVQDHILPCQRVFEQHALAHFFEQQLREGAGNPEFVRSWCTNAVLRRAAEQSMNLAFEQEHIPWRVRVRELNNGNERYGWELDIMQRQSDGTEVVIGTGHPRDSQFQLTPNLRFITRPEFQQLIADSVLGYVDNNCQIGREEQAHLRQAFQLFDQIIEDQPNRRQEVEAARKTFIESINARLSGRGVSIDYVADYNNTGQPALKVMRPGEQDQFISLAPPEPSAARQLGRSWGPYLAYAGVGFVAASLGARVSAGLVNVLYDNTGAFWRGIRGIATPDTRRSGRRGAGLSPEATRVADATVYIEHNGMRIPMDQRSLRELAERAIGEQMRLNEEAMARLPNERSRTPEQQRQFERLQQEQARLRETQAREVEFRMEAGRTPGGKTITGARVRGAVISGFAIAAVLASWYALSRWYKPPTVLPIQR